jgi:hypothetical protein
MEGLTSLEKLSLPARTRTTFYSKTATSTAVDSRQQQDAPYDMGRTTTATGGRSSPLLVRKAAFVFVWAITSLVIDLSLSSLSSLPPMAASLFLPSEVASG